MCCVIKALSCLHTERTSASELGKYGNSAVPLLSYLPLCKSGIMSLKSEGGGEDGGSTILGTRVGAAACLIWL